MGSSTNDDASQKELVEDLVDVGNKLLTLPSAIDELLVLLEKAESILSKVWQQPPRFTKVALIPLMKALITDELLRHTEVKIQVVVASCFNELTRISAPDFTYSDAHMKEFFQLCMIALKHLSSSSGRNYSRALNILETVARVRSCLILLDIDCGALIVEMFQLFFNTIRPNHPSDTFKYMEMIMTMVIQESDEISFELLRPLLDSVKMDNKNISQISWELGNAVFKNCSAKLQCHLREAVKSMNLDIDDYAEIVTSLCQVAKEVWSTDGVSKLDGLSNADPEYFTRHAKNGDRNILDDENSLETINCCQQIMKLKSNNARLGIANEVVDVVKIAQLERESESVRMRRGRISSLQKPEGYEHDWTTGGKDSCEVPHNGKNKAKEIDGSVNEGNLSRRGRTMKKKSMKNQHIDLESSSMLRRKLLHPKVKERGSNITKKIGKRGIAGSSTITEKTEEGTLNDTDSQGKDDLVLLEIHGNKQTQDKIISKKHKSKDVNKRSRMSHLGHGEELVNLKIKVWWPEDKTYYTGTVVSFDPLTKKHEVLYDDDETEILEMDKETWEPFDDHRIRQYSKIQEADPPAPAKEPFETQKKTAKRKPGPSKKQNASSSSKRSKSESGSGIKSGEIPAPNFVYIKDEPDDEMYELNIPSKNDGENPADNPETETPMTKMQPSYGTSLGVTKE